MGEAMQTEGKRKKYMGEPFKSRSVSWAASGRGSGRPRAQGKKQGEKTGWSQRGWQGRNSEFMSRVLVSGRTAFTS